MNTLKHSVKIFIKSTGKFGIFQALKIMFSLIFKEDIRLSLRGFKKNIFLRNRTSDINLFYEIILNNEYNISFNTNIKNVIDGGANIGLFAILVANKYPNSKIICIEPDIDNFNILLKNTKNYPNIFCENKGLWNAKTRLKVYDKFKMGKWGLIVEEDTINGTIDAISIDYITDKYQLTQIDLLKIDIESSEYELFSANYSHWLNLTKNIVIELHDGLKKGCSRVFFTTIFSVFSDYQLQLSGENLVLKNLKK